MTYVVLIGNADNKLTQQEWAAFVRLVGVVIEAGEAEVHFSGAPSSFEPWQNAAWVFEIDTARALKLRPALAALAELFGQESIAWLQGETEMIRP